VRRKLIYSMGASLDGFIAGRAGELDWSAPEEELHRFHNEQTRELDVHLCGRGLYETMLYWETAEENPSSSEVELEFAALWKELPKIVFSSTLESVEGNARLATTSVAQEVARLKEEPGRDLSVGGAGLAGACMELDLIDEYRLFVNPVLLGAGTPYFAPRGERINLELVETQTFGSRVVYLRYRRVRSQGFRCSRAGAP
jgi:dihydrofolate reductase